MKIVKILLITIFVISAILVYFGIDLFGEKTGRTLVLISFPIIFIYMLWYFINTIIDGIKSKRRLLDNIYSPENIAEEPISRTFHYKETERVKKNTMLIIPVLLLMCLIWYIRASIDNSSQFKQYISIMLWLFILSSIINYLYRYFYDAKEKSILITDEGIILRKEDEIKETVLWNKIDGVEINPMTGAFILYFNGKKIVIDSGMVDIDYFKICIANYVGKDKFQSRRTSHVLIYLSVFVIFCGILGYEIFKNKVNNSDKNNSEIYNTIASKYLDSKNYDKAIDMYQKIMDLAPSNPFIYFNCGIAYQGKGDMKRAREFYEQAISNNPKYADAYNNIGVIYDKGGNSIKAMEMYEKAIANNPNDGAPYFNAGLGYLAKGERKKGLQYMKRAVELGHSEAKKFI